VAGDRIVITPGLGWRLLRVGKLLGFREVAVCVVWREL